ncbi:unnamed protein product, partial [marine sediment metagenome]
SGVLPEDTNEGWTNSFTPSIIYDTRDDVFDPTSGWYHTFSPENSFES